LGLRSSQSGDPTVLIERRKLSPGLKTLISIGLRPLVY
jgi:hypothetical protein